MVSFVFGVCVALPLGVLAGTVSGLNVFVNGTVTDADDVNENFDLVVAAIDDNHDRVGFLEGDVADLLARVAALEAGAGTVDFSGNCADHLDAEPGAADGVYLADLDDDGNHANAVLVYCDMTTDGGGWTLLLTQLDASSQFPGTQIPFQDQNVGSPSLTNAYARDWSGLIDPQPNDEFLVMRGNGDWRRFVQSAPWCGWQNTATCNGVTTSGHGHFTQGQLYDMSGNAETGFVYFNTCSNAGNCGSGDGDGVGFGTFGNWSDRDATYGGGYPGGADAGAVFYWGTTTEVFDTPFTYWYRPAPPGGDGSSPAEAAYSCKELRDDHAPPDGAYWVDPDASGALAPIYVYCDMSTGGGGWTLLLTQAHASNQYAGSVTPWQDLNTGTPDPLTPYSRDWDGLLSPAVGSEFMVQRADGAHVRFVQSAAWCGWHNTGVCNGVDPGGHAHFTQGQAFDAGGNALSGFVYFNGCTHVGGCANGGGDGVGFSSHAPWADDEFVYGGGFNSSAGASFFWGTTTPEANTPFSFWYR